MLNRSKSDDWWDSQTFKSDMKKSPKEESKYNQHRSPEVYSKENKKKKKVKRTSKPKKLGLDKMKGYASQTNSFVTK